MITQLWIKNKLKLKKQVKIFSVVFLFFGCFFASIISNTIKNNNNKNQIYEKKGQKSNTCSI